MLTFLGRREELKASLGLDIRRSLELVGAKMLTPLYRVNANKYYKRGF
jgi:hypothetical protein